MPRRIKRTVRWTAAAASVMLVVVGAGAEASRVVALADLYGDYDHAVSILEAADLIKVDYYNGADGYSRYGGARWVGGNATLVQLGDIVDRGSYARDIYALFASLRQQAKEAGGQVVNLVGNHEVMNLGGDLRYVTRKDTSEFGGAGPREEAWSAGGTIGRQILEEFQAAWVASETLFVHAGLLPEHIAQGVDGLNAEVREQLTASVLYRREGELLSATGPFWVRRFAMGKEGSVCPLLEQTLALAGARRMVVGHTQVDEGRVRSRCGGRLLMADTIISRDGYGECWEANSMAKEQCEGSMSYVEVRGQEAFAIRVVPGEDVASLEVAPLPLAEAGGQEL